MAWYKEIVYLIDTNRRWRRRSRRRWRLAWLEAGGRQIGDIIRATGHRAIIDKARAVWDRHGDPAHRPTLFLAESVTPARSTQPPATWPGREPNVWCVAFLDRGTHMDMVYQAGLPLVACLNCGRRRMTLCLDEKSLMVCSRCGEKAEYVRSATTSFIHYRIIKRGRTMT